MTSPTNKGERGNLPKGDVTPQAYLVKRVSVQRSQKWVMSFMDNL